MIKLCRSFFVILLLLVKSSLLTGQEVPALDSVSVDWQSQRVVIGWHVENTDNIDGYFVMRRISGVIGVVDGTYNVITTIDDAGQTTYEDISTKYGEAQPDIRSESYRVASYKIIDGEKEYNNMCEPQSSLRILSVEFDLCEATSKITWSKYIGWEDNIKEYRLYYRNNETETPKYLATTSKNDTVYNHTGFNGNNYFYYIVQAVNTDGRTASSNQAATYSRIPKPPETMTADYATVTAENEITVSFTVDETAEVNQYKLLRSRDINGDFDTIATFSENKATITHTDKVESDKEIYYYKLAAIDICHHVAKLSNAAHNIVLKAYPESNENAQITINELQWNAYTAWSSPPDNYQVYRLMQNNQRELLHSAQPSAETLTYRDDLSDMTSDEIKSITNNGNFCYYIEAYKGDTVSRSNVACIPQAQQVFIANAFNPKSHIEKNRTFRPLVSYGADYQFVIYNKWGNIIFESQDIENGWDGKMPNGEYVNQGTYIYFLRFIDADNNLVEKSGYVTVVYP